MSAVHFDTSENFHPYGCQERSSCRHCERRDDKAHDPGVCPLCDPDYDMQPNPYWKRRARRRAKAYPEEQR